MAQVNVSSVPRKPYAEEALTISTVAVTPNTVKSTHTTFVRGRLEGGPIRYLFLSIPTSTVGSLLFDSDLIELSEQELAQMLATGGMILAASAGGDATLWLTYYV